MALMMGLASSKNIKTRDGVGSTETAQDLSSMVATLYALAETGRYSPFALLALLSLVFAAQTGPVGPALVLALHWCGSVGLEHARIAYRAAPQGHTSALAWARTHMWMSAITGASWALGTVVWFDPDTFSNQALLALCMMTICSGSMLSRAVYPPSMIMHLVLAGTPICALMVLTGAPVSVGVGLCGFAYMAWLFQAARIQYRQHALSRALLLENVDLVADLTDAREAETVARGLAERARDAAEAGNRAKSEFLAIVSHELRTPLNGILGMASVLADGDLSEPQRRAISTIRDAGEALCLIIDDLLDLTRLDAGRARLEPHEVQLARLVDSVAQILRVRAWEKRLTLEVEISPDVPASILGDPGRLRQILINLAGNAVKFTETGGVKIIVTQSLTKAGFLVFEVRDTGIGIPQDAIGRLFQPFTQVDQSYTRMHGGTGLGLAIVKRLATLMGGDVRVTSELGVGSVFTLEIPVTPGAVRIEAVSTVHVEPDIGSAVAPFQPLRILAIDDSVHMRRMLSAVLTAAGHAFFEAETGLDGIALIQKGGIDLVLLDLEMPELDGSATARLIRTLPGSRDLPIIAMSGYDTAHMRMSGFSIAADHTLIKPIKPEVLLTAIQNVHAAHRQAAQVAA